MRSTTQRRFFCWLAAVLPLAACAIPELPPGGPEDREAPQVVSTLPEASAVGVPTDTDIRVEFSEKMQQTRLERQMSFYPGIIIRGSGWRKNTLVVEPEALHPDTTYVVELAAAFTDAHGAKNPNVFRFAFATAAVIDSGSVEGRVFFRRQPSDRAVVRLFVLPKDSAFVPQAGRPDRQVATGPDGTYRFQWLPTNRARMLLWAFQDGNANGVFDAARGEHGQALADTVLLYDQIPTFRRADISIIDPTEPAELSGKIINATDNDSFPITVTLSELSDTLPPTYFSRCDPEGAFEFKPLAGSYILRSFMDFAPDSLCGQYPCPGDSNSSCLEPCSLYPDTVQVTPGGKIRLKDMTLGEPASNGE